MMHGLWEASRINPGGLTVRNCAAGLGIWPFAPGRGYSNAMLAPDSVACVYELARVFKNLTLSEVSKQVVVMPQLHFPSPL